VQIVPATPQTHVTHCIIGTCQRRTLPFREWLRRVRVEWLGLLSLVLLGNCRDHRTTLYRAHTTTDVRPVFPPRFIRIEFFEFVELAKLTHHVLHRPLRFGIYAVRSGTSAFRMPSRYVRAAYRVGSKIPSVLLNPLAAIGRECPTNGVSGPTAELRLGGEGSL
jgi:hypothetical protein